MIVQFSKLIQLFPKDISLTKFHSNKLFFAFNRYHRCRQLSLTASFKHIKDVPFNREIIRRYSSVRLGEYIKNKPNICSINEGVAKCLMKSFGLNSEEVGKIFKNYPKLNEISLKNLESIISILKKEQLCSYELVTKRSWVLLTDPNTLSMGIRVLERHNLLEPMRKGLTHNLVLFLCDKNRFKDICNRINDKIFFQDFDQRMVYFCDNLDINCETFCLIVKNNFNIILKDMDHIRSVMQLLKSNGITNDELVSDHWIFLHNISLMKKRIEECKQNLHPIKTWTLRCPDHLWYPLAKRYKENMEALGECTDKKLFLAKVLNCNLQDVDSVLARHKPVLTIRPKDLQQKVQCIRELGYSFNDIINCPRVLCYKIERIRKRLEKKGINRRLPLYYVFLPEDTYNEYYLKNFSEMV